MHQNTKAYEIISWCQQCIESVGDSFGYDLCPLQVLVGVDIFLRVFVALVKRILLR